MKKFIAITVGLFLACTTPDPVQTPDFEYAHVLGQMTDRQIDEISGISISQRQDSLLWVINDSGDAANIYAISRSGDLIGKVRINDLRNRDWEDMCSFQFADKNYLLIAETGDNDARYGDYHLYIIPEPALQPELPESVDIAWQIDFTYPDGGLDCEAVAVDVAAEKIILISKRLVPPHMYELPLFANTEQVAEFLGEVTTIPQPNPDDLHNYLDQISSQPTSLDIRSDGTQILVLTYKYLYLYSKETNERWYDALQGTPTPILFPGLSQAESACYNRDQQNIIITTENVPAPIILIDPLKL